MPRLFIAAVALLLAGCAGAPPQATPTSDAPTTASNGAAPSDADLQAKWWTWALSSPQARNPVADPTGQFCAEDQPKDVWFLAGTFGGAAQRTCEVPGGRPLAYESTIAAEKQGNVQLPAGRSEAEFVAFRQQRDAGLAAPKLLHQSLQVNIRAGHIPPGAYREDDDA